MQVGIDLTNRAIDAANRNATAALGGAEAAKQAADVARDTLYLTQGADIQLDETAWEPNDKPPMPNLPDATITLWFKNFGHTAATNVVFDMTLGITGTPATSQFPPNPPVNLGTGQRVSYGFTPLRFIFTDVEDLISVVKGERQMRVWGTIAYDDAFDRHIDMRLGYTWIAGTTAFRLDDFEVKRTKN